MLWSAFHDNLHDLCRDGPLTGDYLCLFQAFGNWEQSVSSGRERADEEIRNIAESFGHGIQKTE